MVHYGGPKRLRWYQLREPNLTRQDDKIRLRRRLRGQAVEQAASNRWEEAVTTNQQLITLGEDTDTFNRLGKALFELNRLAESRDAYQRTLRMMPNNPIAKRNVDRIEDLISRSADAPRKLNRQIIDLRLFITETGKSALTTLVEVTRSPVLASLVMGEKVALRVDGKSVYVADSTGTQIGRVEPRLAQRLIDLLQSGNRYAAAIASVDGTTIRLLLRETYQDPSQRARVSFPGTLGASALRGGFVGGIQYDEYNEDDSGDDDAADERDEVEEEPFGNEEEELGLDDIEQGIGDDDDINEE